MICPNCGEEAEFTSHCAEWYERHGLDCGPYERWYSEYLLCRRCGAETDEIELARCQPVEAK